MKRYHEKIYFPDKEKLSSFCSRLNGQNWKFSYHAISQLKNRLNNLEAVLLYIKDVVLCPADIFEYYKREDDFIEKACFRLSYLQYDVILVISDNKTIITVYINQKGDSHFTLKKELYCLN